MLTSKKSFLFCAALALSSVGAQTLDRQYQDVAGRLVGAALTDEGGFQKLTWLCDRIGARLGGSKALEEAVRWSAAEMKREGLANVATPKVMVPHWVRGAESAKILSPIARPLTMLGLGNSIGTPKEGITGEVVAVHNFDELKALGAAKVKGKIVLYNVDYQGYGRTVTYRAAGASRAAELGAVASLVRAVGSATLQTPHTGALNYAASAPKIPAASVTLEDAVLIQRLIDAGETVRVHLQMEAQMLPPAESANVIGEIVGREKPEEVVVLGGHLDSWDVGQGAHDDGTGVMAALQAVVLMKKLGLQPRRTVRVVLWTNEENGLAGGTAYREWVGAAVKKHVAAIEMDGGGERPLGFGIGGGDPKQVELLRQIGKLLDGIGAGRITIGGGGADISPIMREGVPGIGLQTVGTHYFDWHHTHADTLDKVDPVEFKKCTAALAVMAYVLADMPGKLAE